jgi:hypothetical protein
MPEPATVKPGQTTVMLQVQRPPNNVSSSVNLVGLRMCLDKRVIQLDIAQCEGSKQLCCGYVFKREDVS